MRRLLFADDRLRNSSSVHGKVYVNVTRGKIVSTFELGQVLIRKNMYA